jgi:predicted nucleic acid-binding protein
MAEKIPIILDSDVLIDYFNKKSKRHHEIQHQLIEFEENNLPLCISIITKMELIQGSKDKKEINELIKKLSTFNTFNITEEVSQLAFSYIRDFSKSHTLQIPDALIAATSVIFGLALYTYNKRDFKFLPGINLLQ